MSAIAELMIEQKAAFTLAGMRLRCKPGTKDIPQLWGQFNPAVATMPGVTDPMVCYGVCHNFDKETQEFDYVAACEIAEDASLADNMVRVEVPAQSYAVFSSTLPEIGATFDKIYGEWLPNSGYQRAEGPEFELYDEHFDPNDPNSSFRIYVPVTKK